MTETGVDNKLGSAAFTGVHQIRVPSGCGRRRHGRTPKLVLGGLCCFCHNTLFPLSDFRNPIAKGNHCKQATYRLIFGKTTVHPGKNYAIYCEFPIVGGYSTPAQYPP